MSGSRSPSPYSRRYYRDRYVNSGRYRSRSPERRRYRSRSRSPSDRYRYSRHRSYYRSRSRSRSLEDRYRRDIDRRSRRDSDRWDRRRSRSRSRSREYRRSTHRSPSRSVEKPVEKPSRVVEEEGAVVDPDQPMTEANEQPMDEEEAMKAIMGFTGFTSTKGEHVPGTDMSGADIRKPRTYRQYMNRRGGFNRPLDKVN